MAKTQEAEKKVVSKKKNDDIVIVRCKNPKRTNGLIFDEYRDENGEVRFLKDSNGNKRVMVFSGSPLILNLSKPEDKDTFEYLKEHVVFIKKSHHNGGDPQLYFVHETRDAEEYLRKVKTSKEALNIVDELATDAMYNFGRILGIDLNNTNSSVVRRKLFEIAQDNPSKIIDEWNNPDRPFKELLSYARSKGVFTVGNGVWKYRQQTVGTNFDEALLWLKANDDLHVHIRKEAEENQ